MPERKIPIDGLKALIRLAALKQVPFKDWADDDNAQKKSRKSSGSRRQSIASQVTKKPRKKVKNKSLNYKTPQTKLWEKRFGGVSVCLAGAVAVRVIVNDAYSKPLTYSLQSDDGTDTSPYLRRLATPVTNVRVKRMHTAKRHITWPTYKKRLLADSNLSVSARISEMLQNASSKTLPSGVVLRLPSAGISLQTNDSAGEETDQEEDTIDTDMDLNQSESVVATSEPDSIPLSPDLAPQEIAQCAFPASSPTPLLPSVPREPKPLQPMNVSSPVHRKVVAQSIEKLEKEGKDVDVRLLMLDWCSMRQEQKRDSVLDIANRRHELLDIASDLLVNVGKPSPLIANPTLLTKSHSLEVQIQSIISQQLSGRIPLCPQYKGNSFKRYILLKP
eukprot:TRINITY_DN11527_c0_g2_i1.p1 TRINITY_DN11527_c0_g2~~TRINITY_DN11527_c0_g2_i1.p1  ORF type:complete len:389 (+),score=67.17 TRINITY_DN11527_c0_g2_i1:61-1227(+)